MGKKVSGLYRYRGDYAGQQDHIFEAPQYGVAVWWELLRRYAAEGVETVGGIIKKYGGGQDYSAYISFVTRQTGFSSRKKVLLDDDGVLLAFGKAMFHYEAGRRSMEFGRSRAC